MERSENLWMLGWRRLKADRVAMVSLGIVLAFFVMIALSAMGVIAKDWAKEVGVPYASPSFLPKGANLEASTTSGVAENVNAPVDYSAIDPLAKRYTEWKTRAAELAKTEQPRAETLPFGGDKWGRDVLSKAIKGAEISIFVGLAGAFLATLIGIVLGAISGYFGRWIGDILEWFYNVFTSIPYILLILTFAAVLKPGISTIIVVLGCTGWTGIYRLVRAEYIKHSNREYVRAAQAIGASHTSRIFTHILPNISHVGLVQFSLHVVQFIKAEVILSFLGFGVPVDKVSWGTMLSEAQAELVIGKWWQLAAAGIGMAIAVTALALLTDALRDALDPKLRGVDQA